MIEIRSATVDDAEELLAIYAPYVTDTAITFEYEVPSVEEFAQRIAATLERYPYLVAVEDGKLLGYAYVGTFHARKAYDWAVETSIYVRRDLRRGGIGRALHDKMEEVCRKQHIENLCACIAAPRGDDPYLTDQSIGFHEHMGYRMVGRFDRCAYKFDRWYDMVWMEKHLGAHAVPVPEFEPFDPSMVG